MEAAWAHRPGSNPCPALPVSLRLPICEMEGTWSLDTAKVKGENAGLAWACVCTQHALAGQG